MKAYKGTNVNVRCRGFQFQPGVWVEIPPEVKLELCNNGFHFCHRLFDVQFEYDICTSRFWEIEVDETAEILSPPNENKACCRRMRLVRELTFAECLTGFNLDDNGNEFALCQNTNVGFGNHGNYNYGNNNHGNNNHGNDNHGNYNYGNNNPGNDNHGNDNHGNYNRGNNNRGNDNHGNNNL